MRRRRSSRNRRSRRFVVRMARRWATGRCAMQASKSSRKQATALGNAPSWSWTTAGALARDGAAGRFVASEGTRLELARGPRAPWPPGCAGDGRGSLTRRAGEASLNRLEDPACSIAGDKQRMAQAAELEATSARRRIPSALFCKDMLWPLSAVLCRPQGPRLDQRHDKPDGRMDCASNN